MGDGGEGGEGKGRGKGRKGGQGKGWEPPQNLYAAYAHGRRWPHMIFVSP
jgi:hypothetical protein